MTTQYGLLVDIDRCVGCGVCVAACKQENDLPPHYDDVPGKAQIAWNQVLAMSGGKYPDLWQHHVPVHCMHCGNPPCVPSCPASAIVKNNYGIVLIHAAKCNACQDQPGKTKRCLSACPYNAIQFNEKANVAQACTLCIQRVAAGVEPACVRACIGRCLTFGDYGDPQSGISKLAQAAGENLVTLECGQDISPSIKYIQPSITRKTDLNRLSPFTRMIPVYGYGSHLNKPAQ